MAQTSGFDPMTQVKTCFDCKMFDVAKWVACLSMEKMVPEGHFHMRSFQFHFKEHWRFPQSLDSLLPWTETISAHLEWWQNPTNVMKGADLHPKQGSRLRRPSMLNTRYFRFGREFRLSVRSSGCDFMKKIFLL